MLLCDELLHSLQAAEHVSFFGLLRLLLRRPRVAMGTGAPELCLRTPGREPLIGKSNLTTGSSYRRSIAACAALKSSEPSGSSRSPAVSRDGEVMTSLALAVLVTCDL